MRSFGITMHYSAKALRQPAAWLVAGSGAGEWLAEIGRWGVPLSDLTLYPVPATAATAGPQQRW